MGCPMCSTRGVFHPRRSGDDLSHRADSAYAQAKTRIESQDSCHPYQVARKALKPGSLQDYLQGWFILAFLVPAEYLEALFESRDIAMPFLPVDSWINFAAVTRITGGMQG